jgi:uncharacterized protein YpbB
MSKKDDVKRMYIKALLEIFDDRVSKSFINSLNEHQSRFTFRDGCLTKNIPYRHLEPIQVRLDAIKIGDLLLRVKAQTASVTSHWIINVEDLSD